MDGGGLAKLFTSFTQADPSIRSRFGGTGLGLALNQRLCRLIVGDIAVANRKGSGFCVTVWPPAEGADEEARPLPEAVVADAGVAAIAAFYNSG